MKTKISTLNQALPKIQEELKKHGLNVYSDCGIIIEDPRNRFTLEAIGNAVFAIVRNNFEFSKSLVWRKRSSNEILLSSK